MGKRKSRRAHGLDIRGFGQHPWLPLDQRDVMPLPAEQARLNREVGMPVIEPREVTTTTICAVLNGILSRDPSLLPILESANPVALLPYTSWED